MTGQPFNWAAGMMKRSHGSMVAARELGGSDAAILFQGQHGEPMMCDDFFEPRQRRMWQLQLSLRRARPTFTPPGLRDKRGGVAN